MNGPAYSQRSDTNHCSDVQSTAETLACINKANKMAQDHLNEAYKITAETDTMAKSRAFLSNAQQAWIAYRSAQCAWEADLAYNPSLKRIYELSCINDLTEQRADLLNAIRERESHPAPREFSEKPRWVNVLAHDNPEIFWRYGTQLHADLNCDGQDEYIMPGMTVTAMAPPEDPSPATPAHKNTIIIAIADNPPTGRPKTTLISIPVTAKADRANTEKAGLCGAPAQISIVTDNPDTNDTPAAAENTKNGRTAPASAMKKKSGPKSCTARLRIQDNLCPPLILEWTGSRYETRSIEVNE